MTFAAVRKMALALEGVEEATSYGTPAFKLRGAFMGRFLPELDALVLPTSMEGRAELIAADPETYFITDHYLKYPYILVRLSRVHPDAMQDLLRGAWRSAAASKKPTKRRGTRGKLDE
jgi:hypothetical protein